MLLKQLNSIQHTEVWNWTKKTHKMTEMADAIYDLLMIANFAWKRGSGAKDSMLKPLHSASCLTLPLLGLQEWWVTEGGIK